MSASKKKKKNLRDYKQMRLTNGTNTSTTPSNNRDPDNDGRICPSPYVHKDILLFEPTNKGFNTRTTNRGKAVKKKIAADPMPASWTVMAKKAWIRRRAVKTDCSWTSPTRYCEIMAPEMQKTNDKLMGRRKPRTKEFRHTK